MRIFTTIFVFFLCCFCLYFIAKVSKSRKILVGIGSVITLLLFGRNIFLLIYIYVDHFSSPLAHFIFGYFNFTPSGLAWLIVIGLCIVGGYCLYLVATTKKTYWKFLAAIGYIVTSIPLTQFLAVSWYSSAGTFHPLNRNEFMRVYQRDEPALPLSHIDKIYQWNFGDSHDKNRIKEEFMTILKYPYSLTEIDTLLHWGYGLHDTCDMPISEFVKPGMSKEHAVMILNLISRAPRKVNDIPSNDAVFFGGRSVYECGVYVTFVNDVLEKIEYYP